MTGIIVIRTLTGRDTRIVSRRIVSEYIVIRRTGHDTRIVSRRMALKKSALKGLAVAQESSVQKECH